MTALPEKDVASNFLAGSSSNCINRDHTEKDLGSRSSEQISNNVRPSKAVSWSSFLTSFSISELTGNLSSCEKKGVKHRSYGLASAVRKVMSGNSMRRLQERILGTCKADVTSSTSEIWLLGVCYKLFPDESSSKECLESGLSAFQQDFSSRIWVTYRKGFDSIGDSKFTSDVNWGCMIRSSQMLVAQALTYHHLGRSWRRSLEKPHDPKYVAILHLFGDSESSAFSIHNLLKAGVGYGLAAGSWVGPYAMCRSWEVLSRADRENAVTGNGKQSLPMVLYIVSGDEDGERGGAPVLCIDVASRLCSDICDGQLSWAPMLLLVPLVLGLDKVNPRYIPLLKATFTFPQSLGIVGGKPGASTYIVGVQDDRALYLDPHEVQMVADISIENLDADTSSYHCSTVRHLPLEQIDPSLAIGFYCRDKDDFDDFCARAAELMERSNGAPLFTIAQSLPPSMQIHNSDVLVGSTVLSGNMEMEEVFHAESTSDGDTHRQEDEWQLL